MKAILPGSLPLLVGILSAVVAQTVQVYSGFSTECQSCLDNATSLCDSSRAFENCVCLGDGFEEVMSTCIGELGICNRPHPESPDVKNGQLFLDQWAAYCCTSMPENSECGKAVASNAPSAPTTTTSTHTSSSTGE